MHAPEPVPFPMCLQLSDFGLCRVMNKNGEMITTRTFGTVTHMPSELLAKGMIVHGSVLKPEPSECRLQLCCLTCEQPTRT